MEFRKATEADIAVISKIYEATHTEEERGNITVGWIRNVYPMEETAKAALQRGDLFVGIDDGMIFGTAIINQQQVDVYKNGHWEYTADEHEVMVLHALVIDPMLSGKGYGKKFVDFYETYAMSQGCRYLRMDTQVINKNARMLYKKLGYKEIDVVPCTFNGIEGVQMVLLEKKIGTTEFSCNEQYNAFLNEFGKGRKMVLSTSLNDKVTSRMMSVIQQNGIFYFQTDKHFRKYNQLIENNNVALCIDNIQIEGICKELDHPLENPDFCSLYKECFPSSFERYSSLNSEVLFEVTPVHLERWLYKEGTPFVESFDIVNQEYYICEYNGERN